MELYLSSHRFSWRCISLSTATLTYTVPVYSLLYPQQVQSLFYRIGLCHSPHLSLLNFANSLKVVLCNHTKFTSYFPTRQLDLQHRLFFFFFLLQIFRRNPTNHQRTVVLCPQQLSFKSSSSRKFSITSLKCEHSSQLRNAFSLAEQPPVRST
jgi:hypothetical protein